MTAGVTQGRCGSRHLGPSTLPSSRPFAGPQRTSERLLSLCSQLTHLGALGCCGRQTQVHLGVSWSLLNVSVGVPELLLGTLSAGRASVATVLRKAPAQHLALRTPIPAPQGPPPSVTDQCECKARVLMLTWGTAKVHMAWLPGLDHLPTPQIRGGGLEVFGVLETTLETLSEGGAALPRKGPCHGTPDDVASHTVSQAQPQGDPATVRAPGHGKLPGGGDLGPPPWGPHTQCPGREELLGCGQ